MNKKQRHIEANQSMHEELLDYKEENVITLEKSDTFAIIIAMLTTVFPFALAIFLGVMALFWILFT